jgi:hypothetical protein
MKSIVAKLCHGVQQEIQYFIFDTSAAGEFLRFHAEGVAALPAAGRDSRRRLLAIQKSPSPGVSHKPIDRFRRKTKF